MPNPLPIVLADLRRSRPAALALVLLVAIATALGVAVSAQERALRRGSTAAAEPFDLLIGAPGSATQLVSSTILLEPAPLDLLEPGLLDRVSRDPDARIAAPLGFGDRWQGHPIVGTTPAFIAHLAAGGLAEGRLPERLEELVVGARVALRPGQEITPSHGRTAPLEEGEHALHEGFAYRVVGRLRALGSPWDRALVGTIEAVWLIHGLPLGRPLPEETPEAHAEDDRDGHTEPAHAAHAEAARDGQTGHAHAARAPPAIPIGPPWELDHLPGVPAIVVEPVSVEAAYRLRRRYDAEPGAMALFPAEVLVELHRLLGGAREVLTAVALATQVLVVGAILMAVLATLAQRRRLIGVLRALGASRGFVLAAVWLEVAILLALGALLGLALGWLGALLLSALLEARTQIALEVVPAVAELRLVLVLLLAGLALAALPAWLAWRAPVAAALRG